MKIAKISSTLIALATATSALAHNAAIPHAHPHESSSTLSIATVLTIGGIAVLGTLAYFLMKQTRSNARDI